MKVYISGAITGTDDYMERFAAAEATLKLVGHVVINPAKVLAQMPEDTTHEEYMKMSFVMLDMCEAIAMIPGWEKSHGASMEYGYALAKDKVIMLAVEGRWVE